MTAFTLSSPLVDDSAQQRNNDDLLRAINQISQFLYWGTGAPTLTPTGRALYIDIAGGAGTTLYVHEGGGWAAK